MGKAYPVPVATIDSLHETEQVISKSRFLAQGCRCSSRSDALSVVKAVRARYPSATHHCWAYVAGEPGNSADVGSADDGEPHGTAGRPMLKALLHCGIGQICVVISRWFGGIKLGTGGLTRAYRAGVVENTAQMPVEIAEARVWCQLLCSYADLDTLRKVLESMKASTIEEKYDADVTMIFRVPEVSVENLTKAVAEASSGRGAVQQLRASQFGNLAADEESAIK